MLTSSTTAQNLLFHLGSQNIIQIPTDLQEN